jgi:hypothetical protein
MVCPTGFGDCDGNPANGCETSLVGNRDHYGACANACVGWCDQTTCKDPEVLASGQNFIVALDLSPTDIYWASSADPADSQFFVQRLAKAGGAPAVLAFDLPPLFDLKVDSSGAYFTSEDTVFRTGLEGGALVAFGTPGYYPRLALGGLRVYWTMSYTMQGQVLWKSESAAPSDPGATLVSMPFSVGTHGGISLTGVVPTLGQVFFAGRDDAGSFIAQVGSNGGQATKLVTPAGTIRQMVVRHDALFYIEASAASSSNATVVRRLPLGGTSPTTLIDDGWTTLVIAADASFLYVTQEDATDTPLGLKRYSAQDGTGETLMVSSVASSALAVDDTYVYFVTNDALARVPK